MATTDALTQELAQLAAHRAEMTVTPHLVRPASGRTKVYPGMYFSGKECFKRHKNKRNKITNSMVVYGNQSPFGDVLDVHTSAAVHTLVSI